MVRIRSHYAPTQRMLRVHYYIRRADRWIDVGEVRAWFTPAAVWISDLWVDPQQRSGGIGRLLMQAVLRRADRLATPCCLQAEPFGTAAPPEPQLEAFYRSLGFVDNGIVFGVHNMRRPAPSAPAEELCA